MSGAEAASSGLSMLTDAVAAVGFLVRTEDGDDRQRAELLWQRVEARLRASADSAPLGDLAARFRLSSFELRCLVLALAGHMDPKMPEIVASAGGSDFARAVTVRLAIDRLWIGGGERLLGRQAFLASAPLVHHGLVVLGRTEVGGNDGLLGRRMEAAPATLRHVLEEDDVPDTLSRHVRLERPLVSILNVILPAARLDQVRQLVETHSRYRAAVSEWGFDRVLPYGRGCSLLFSGPPGTGKTLLAQALAAHVRRPLLTLSATDLPEREGVDAVLRDLFAEATTREAIVLIDECEALLGRGDKRRQAALRAVEDFSGVLILTTNHPELLDEGLERRLLLHVPFELPDPAHRRQIWEVHLPPEAPVERDVDLETLSNTYDFTGGTIKNAVLYAVNRALSIDPDEPRLTTELLEEGCRSQLRSALEDLTVRTTTHLRLGDIVLPAESQRKLQEIVGAIRNHTTVLNLWGFGRRLVTGTGSVLLFDGPSGTGKTLCAEILAGEFDRPLYRVNLPEVVSNWVGETEKHIRTLFQAARVAHAMLLFDEADALFSARSAEPKSSTDRYANMEVNLLLQEIERFPGVCILTTNSFGALDKALIRRIQFRLTFEEPEADERRRIFETLCPREARLGPDVDFGAAARGFELTGGMIKNAPLRAAYRACDGGRPITQAILADACREECQAAGKLPRAARPVRPAAAVAE